MTDRQIRLDDGPVLKLIIQERVLRKFAWIYTSRRDHDIAAGYRSAAADMVAQISRKKPTSVAGAIALLELGSTLDDNSMIAAAADTLNEFRNALGNETARAA